MRARRQACLLALASIVLSGCEVLEPCKLSRAGLDGIWNLSHVNNTPLPPDGYPIPNQFSFLTSGILVFATTGTSSPGCKSDDAVNRGNFSAYYELRNTDKPRSEVSGNFTYSLKTGEIILTSSGKSAAADRFGNEITVEQTLPGLGTFRLTFRFAHSGS